MKTFDVFEWQRAFFRAIIRNYNYLTFFRFFFFLFSTLFVYESLKYSVELTHVPIKIYFEEFVK